VLYSWPAVFVDLAVGMLIDSRGGHDVGCRSTQRVRRHDPAAVRVGDNVAQWRGRWWNARSAALQAAGLYQYGEETKLRLQPDAPDLTADRFHPWVWEAARPFSESGNRTEAVGVAARAVNGRLQQKLGRRDLGETKLCRNAFSLTEPKPGEPRLRFASDRTSDTWKSRQQGAENFGAGCFTGIRNPAAHEFGLVLGEPSG